MIFSVVLSVLSSRFLLGITYLIFNLGAGRYYSLNAYLEQAVKEVWVGLALTLVVLPLIILGLGKSGILRILGKDYMQ